MNVLKSKDSTDLFTLEQTLDLLNIPQITFNSPQPLVIRQFGRFDDIGGDNPELWE